MEPVGESAWRGLRLGASAGLGIGLVAWCPWVLAGLGVIQGLSFLGAVVLGIIWRGCNHRLAYQWRWLPGLLCWISLSTGLASIQGPGLPSALQADGLPLPTVLSRDPPTDNLGSDLLLMQIHRQDGPRKYRGIVYQRLKYWKADQKWRCYPLRHPILLSLPYSHQPSEKSGIISIEAGHHLLIEATHLQAIRGPAHPGQADLRDYYRSQGLQMEINLSHGGSYRVIRQDLCHHQGEYRREQSFKVKFGRWQSYWSQRMDHSISDSVGRALSKALLLGWRVDLSQELQEGFRNSGTVHLLAVSGMHVLFIYQILQALMRGLYLLLTAILPQSVKRQDPSKWLIFIVLSTLILGYALLTGGAPSAMRSALVVIWMNLTTALSGNRHASSALVLIAVLLIILEPCSWKDPGFQLSFGAVGGLLWIYTPLWKLMRMDQRGIAIRYPASLLGMSLIAQAVTAPLCWFHFGQFPNYFLLANLFLVPLSSPLLVVAIVWTLTGSTSFLGIAIAWVGQLLFGITALMTTSIGSWPGAVTYHWDFRGSDLMLVFSMLVLLTLGLFKIIRLSKSQERRRVFRYVALSLMVFWILLLVNRNARWLQEDQASQCLVFGLRSGNCLLVRDRLGWLWSGDREGLSDRRTMEWIRKQLKRPDHPWATLDTTLRCRLLQWNEPVTLIAGMKDTFNLAPCHGRALQLVHLFGPQAVQLTRKVDAVVLGSRSRVEWPLSQPPTCLIMVGSHSHLYRRLIASLCLQEGIVFCDLSQSNLPDSKVNSPYPTPNRTL
ncbi:MAG: ComEC/Rec2 family competence protein [Bacteroidota bacterium]